MKRLSTVLAAGLLPVLAAVALADQTEMLINTLAEKGVISYGDASLIRMEGKQEARKALAAGSVETLPAWIQNMTIKGDLRLRHQVNWAPNANHVRTRERLRLRLGFETRPIESLLAGFGLATASMATSGSDVIDKEPSSTNHTFGGGFLKAPIMVDFAYLQYNPIDWLTLTGGKMKAGTQVWNTTDLLWDTDINPDGLALTLKQKYGAFDLFLNSSWLIFNDLNSAVDDPTAYIVQPGVTWTPTENIKIKAAIARQQLNVGNKNTGYYGTPTFDYVALNPSLDISFTDIFMGYSASLFGDTVTNTDSMPASDKSGSAFGVKFGAEKVAKFGDWQVVAMQRRLETNAWLGKLPDSDAYDGSSNSKGLEVIVTMGLTKSLSLGLDYYDMDRINSASAATPRSLLQADLVYKF